MKMGIFLLINLTISQIRQLVKLDFKIQPIQID
jgi:hypothetical protein